jgi:hypothetical protein
MSGTDPILDIRVKWDQFGYIVVGMPDAKHQNGPRAAAETAARLVFPDGYKLTVVTPRYHYKAVAA